jgi:hypothetical protein
VGCASIFVDVDNATAGNYVGHTFYLSSCLGAEAIYLDQVAAGAATTAGATPDSCAAQLAGISPSPQVTLPVSAGLSFCLLTTKDPAARPGLPQRIAIVTVTQVAPDSSLTLSISTWHQTS